ncbi:hypothetical protein ACV33W_16940 [Pseudomonas aeruginosa]
MKAFLDNLSLLGVLAVIFLYIRYRIRLGQEEERRLKAIPTLKQYLEQYPECKTARGIKCYRCDAGSIRNWGHENGQDPRRRFVCNHCGTTLYRSDDW